MNYLLLTLLAVFCSEARAEEPEEFLNLAGIVSYWRYPVLKYDVVTKDGYIIELYRIPHGIREGPRVNCSEKKPAILFNHGLLSSGSAYVFNRPDQSAAFIFADAGFDVFIMNARGNIYGRKHISMSEYDAQFWMFSFDEIARYDVTASIDKALEISGQSSLYFVGHSQGTETGLMMLSQFPEYNLKIKKFFGWTPVYSSHGALGIVSLVPHVFTMWKWLADFYVKHYGSHDFCWPIPFLFKPIVKLLCTPNTPQFQWCKIISTFVFGPSDFAVNMTRIPVYFAHSPEGTSTMNMLHWAQNNFYGRVRYFDYGSAVENEKRYGTFEPPAYNYSKITAPLYLFWSENDWLSPNSEIHGKLKKVLQPGVLKKFFNIPSFNHIDFAVSLRAPELVYKPMLNIIMAEEQLC